MVAPSLNVKFSEGDSFRLKVVPVPGLAPAIMKYLKSWPNLGEVVCKDIRKAKFPNGGKDYVIVFTRRAHLVGLMNLFEIPKDAKLLKDYLEKVLEIYCGGKK